MLQPMLASLEDAPLTDPNFVYEPKYDGIRAIVEIAAGGEPVRLWSRLGNEKTAQFPEIARALADWGRSRREPVVLDGEIVALNADGQPAGFQNLQGRIHLKEIVAGRRSPSRPSSPPSPSGPSRPSSPSGPSVAFIAFDVLRDGQTDLRNRPLTERRAILERLLPASAEGFGEARRSALGAQRRRKTGSPILRISEQVAADGRALHDRALASGWEGLIAKRALSRYVSGKRSSDWRKLKIHQEQEFVIGGWTEPRQSRMYFGALVLGVFDRGALTYAGHVGTGFNERELQRLMRLMKPIEIATSPFASPVPTNERPHWVEPTLVAQVRFTEWTADGILRHPVYLGLRDDKKAADVTREEKKTKKNADVGSGFRRTPKTKVRLKPDMTYLLDQLREIEASHKDGLLELPDGDKLRVTNLQKIFWPKQKLTKGDLFRYYVQVAPEILPAIADRPLVMKRFPNGVAAAPFYQHRAEQAPSGVRIEAIKAAERRPQIIGGGLTTLLYTTQLAAISQDPWFSRVQSLQDADFVALDLDPSTGASFERVLDVARWIHDELQMLGAPGFAKTSGADGLHIYIPLPRGTSYEAGLLFAQIVATVVSQKHPKEATIERAVRARGNRVYIDCLQNILGKTLASAYSARASDYAGVSTPLSWKEVDQGVSREDFTIQTVPARIANVGDLWAGLTASKGADLTRVSRYAAKR